MTSSNPHTMTEQQISPYPRFGFLRISRDRQAIYLAALFLAVQVGAVWLAMTLQSSGAAAGIDSPGNADGAAAGAGWAIAEVAFASLLVVGIYTYRKVPESWREPFRNAVLFAIIYYAGWIYGSAGAGLPFLTLFIGGYLGMKLIEGLGLWWLVNNALAVVIAIGGAAVLGHALNEWALLTFLAGMTVYDYVFADKRGWMMELAGLMVHYRLPVLFVKPDQYRFDWDNLLSDDDGEALAEAETAWGIGTADLMLPAAFTAAVVTGETVLLPVVAAAVLTGGVVLAALRIRQKMLTNGSGAGLPPLTAGVVGAYACVLVPSLLYTMVIA